MICIGYSLEELVVLLVLAFHQRNVTACCVVVSNVVVLSISLNSNVSIVQIARVSDQSAAGQVANSAVISLDGDVLGAVPSGNNVLGAVGGVLNNIIGDYCVVVIATAGGIGADVDKCNLSVVGVAGLVSNSDRAGQVLIIAGSSLTGNYLVAGLLTVIALLLTA